MFHIPDEKMRITYGPMGTAPNEGNYGAFLIPSCEPGWCLVLICDDGTDPDHPSGWEHVSVRAVKTKQEISRVPTWREMCHVKDRCWEPEDVVMQLHPAKSQYVDMHPHVLHLWRPLNETIPLPTLELV